jgi:excisionase family DNA binding protein
LLTTQDAAKRLGISTSRVRQLAHGGELAFESTQGGQLIFHRSEIDRCLQARADARARSRDERLRQVRVRMLRATLEPRQLRLWGERPVRDRVVKAADVPRKSA